MQNFIGYCEALKYARLYTRQALQPGSSRSTVWNFSAVPRKIS